MGWFEELTASASPGSELLAVDRRGQKKSNWCWAASGEMVMDHLGVDVTQCDQVNKQFGLTTCCQSATLACNKTGWPEFNKYGFTFDTTHFAPLSWDDIVTEITDERTPFCFTKKSNGGGGHMLVVFGYTEIDGEPWVWVHDPLPVNTGSTHVIPYAEYDSGTDYTHWHDYYQIRLDE